MAHINGHLVVTGVDPVFNSLRVLFPEEIEYPDLKYDGEEFFDKIGCPDLKYKYEAKQADDVVREEICGTNKNKIFIRYKDTHRLKHDFIEKINWVMAETKGSDYGMI